MIVEQRPKGAESLAQVDKVKERIENQKVILDFWSSKGDTIFTVPSYSIKEANVKGEETKGLSGVIRTPTVVTES